MKIVFATSNKNKIKEALEILGDSEFEIVSAKDVGVSMDVEENGTTFLENALIKARYLTEKTGLACMADDSGLEVDYINKEPGIYSARYMGEDTSYDIKNANIIERVKDAVGEERSARFVCAIAVTFPDGSELTAVDTIEGQVAMEPAGCGGFGYDPIMYVPELGKTTAELTAEEKNAISHRGKAMRKMRQLLLDRDCE